MKVAKKVSVFILIFVAALGILFFFSQKKAATPTTTQQPQAEVLPPTNDPVVSRDAVVASLQTFAVNVKDMPASLQAKNKQWFEAAKKQLNDAAQQVKDKGATAEVDMYWPLENLGHINRDLGNYDKARDAYLLAHQISPGSFLPYGDLGELSAEYYKDYPKAVVYYLHAASVDSAYVPQYYYDLFQLYKYQLNDEAKAENILIQGVTQYPKQYDILAQLALYYRQSNQTDKAIARYKELLQKNPQSGVAQQALKELQQ